MDREELAIRTDRHELFPAQREVSDIRVMDYRWRSFPYLDVVPRSQPGYRSFSRSSRKKSRNCCPPVPEDPR